MTNTKRDELAARLLHHGAKLLDPGEPVVAPIVPAAVFHLPGVPGNAPYQYGRFHNPTWDRLEGALSLLEDAEAIVFPSGMAAIAAVLYATLKSGDRILLPSDGYYTTRALSGKFLAPLGVSIATRATAEFSNGGFAGFRLVLIETPSNPGLDVCDIAAIAAEAKSDGALVVVDNTTMTPLGQRPLGLGADATVTADTKAINGHSDALFGHVATRNGALAAQLREWRKFSGAIPGPFEAWLVYRGIETLDVRFERMCATAALIAARLAEHSKVVSVRYPGLAGDPSHKIAARQMANFGFLIAATLRDASTADRFIAECAYLQASTSFGGVRTSAERRARWGDAVPEGFLRISIGLEPAEALWRAFADALEGLK